MNRVPLGVALAAWCVATAPLLHAQVDSVRVGSPSLDPSGLVEGDYVIESVVRADGTDTPLSTTTQSVKREVQGGADVYVIHSVHASAEGDTTVGTIVVRARDLALIHHGVVAAGDSAAVTAHDAHLTGWVALPGEPPRLVDRRLDHAVFPVEGPVPWLFPLLPLADGYAAAVPHFSQWEGREQWTTIRVTGSERVSLGGTEVDCWKVDGGELFPGYRVTYWIDRGARRVVQGVARGPEGEPEYWSFARKP